MTAGFQNTHSERLNPEKIKLINFISFLNGFSWAMAAYILSSYFMKASGTQNVSIFYLLAYSLILASLLNFHKLVRFLGKSQIFYTLLILQAIILAILSFVGISNTGIILLIVYLATSFLISTSCDILLESFSEDKMSGRIRGFNLMILNVGLLMGPYLSTQILDSLGYKGIFLIKLVITMFIFMVAYFGLNKFNKKCEYSNTVAGLVKSVIKRKDVMRIYSISFVLEFFYAIMVIYTPIYLQQLGMTWEQIGPLFTIMLIPFVLIQYPLGIVADKKFGEKELIITALCIMIPSVLIINFIDSTDFLSWAVVLFMTRIGAATLEIMRESYFYKRVDGDDVGIIDFFRTASPLAYVTASIITAVMLFWLPIKSLFILLTAVLIIGLYPASKLIDNPGESEMEKK
jgi:MFS family permease